MLRTNTPFVKKKVIGKLHPVSKSDIQVENDSQLKNQFVVICLGSPGNVKEIVIHRPIGISGLDDETEWVMSEKADLPDLLARVKDPSEQRLQQERHAFMLKSLFDNKKLFLVDEKSDQYCYPSTKNDRTEVVNSARQRLKEQRKLEKVQTESNSLRKVAAIVSPLIGNNQTGKFSQPDYVSFILNRKDQDDEIQVLIALRNPDLIRESEEKFPQTFRTAGGPLEDRLQMAVGILEGVPTDRVESVLIKHLFSLRVLDVS